LIIELALEPTDFLHDFIVDFVFAGLGDEFTRIYTNLK
jgi:hypothetical protein